ncbi:double-strand break repair protein AddB [uncultured Litoreibacter sp.]|uniref:double-strand break repair protein AddB n=1 Tax=uncultured Litoreibacter sp. TaxID=1392394 RepID=UPI00261BD7F3|nr:double-strand break repair protein AddB [uncultured Litoreibacter sp.]
MFDPSKTARVFGMPPGIDFPRALVSGLITRFQSRPPEDLARVQLYMNTARMKRRVGQLFAEHGAMLLPRLHLITDLSRDPHLDLPPATDGLVRRLELAQLVRKLIETEETLAARDMAFDLADSLATLLEEMQGEGVSIEQILALDVAQHSDHWKRSLTFIELVRRFLDPEAELDTEGRQRAVVEALASSWDANPPEHPIIVAGSTGSRGTTRAFMRAVSRLPQGALVLPGFDFDMPGKIWAKLGATRTRPAAEDHPQFRYHRLMEELSLTKDDIASWAPGASLPSQSRNKLVSLALRPAPVTDAWLDDGPDLLPLTHATEALTLVEAPTQRVETLAIAMRLRKAAQEGTTAALITTDQTLTRRVTAALSAWHITPNDSAGARLDLSPPGRLLRQTAAMIGQDVTPDRMLALLKHPLVYADNRSAHLGRVRHLEMKVLRGGPPALTQQHSQNWAEEREAEDPGTVAWHDWLWSCIAPLASQTAQPLGDLVALHQQIAERLTQGPDDGTPHLWLKTAGETAQAVFAKLAEASGVAGHYTAAEYSDLVSALLSKEEVRDPFFTHANIMIWGTLEARVQGAELVILAGLNDGTWPAMPNPDPWLNRDMRGQAGLYLPESRIGLSAHDFQQAIAAPEVWLTRSVRDAEAETVQSRWLNRLQNLMTGLPGDGPKAFEKMRSRGKEWVDLAQAYDTPRLKLPKAARPSPQPPVDHRPRNLWVTHIETLIRDPYAVYARHILKLRPLKPLHAEADAALRGDVIHKVLQAFIAEHKSALPEDAADRLLERADEFLHRHVAWPATRAFWRAKLARAVPWFIQSEQARRKLAKPDAFEADGTRTIDNLGFTLNGRADRIDRDPSGALVLYDYKTGTLPTKPMQEHFNKQLPLLAALQYEGFPSADVAQVSYVGLGASPEEIAQQLTPDEVAKIWSELEALISAYMDPDKGYPSRRAVHENRWDQDYDTLARYGEWDITEDPMPRRVGR